MLRRSRSSLLRMFAAVLSSWSLAGHAVEVNPAGIGEVLIFPYYTAESTADEWPFATLVSISNSSDRIKAARVRFYEAELGRSALEFTVYLGPHDTWTGAVVRHEDGAGLATQDLSCTDPPISRDEYAPTLLGRDPLTGASLYPPDKVREGHIEVFQLGDYGTGLDPEPGSIAEAVRLTRPESGPWAPTDCSRVLGHNGVGSTLAPGALFGTAIYVNALRAIDVVGPAVALVNFNTTQTLWFPQGTGRPNLTDANPAVSVVREPLVGTIRTQWEKSIEAVSAVLMSTVVSGEVILDAVTASQTTWVLTLPTRSHHVIQGQPTIPPFVTQQSAQTQCEPVSSDLWGMILFDRNGRAPPPPSGFLTPPRPARGLCWASNVINFNAIELLTSRRGFGYVNINVNYHLNNVAPVAALIENGTMRLPLHLDALPSGAQGQVPTHIMVGGATTIQRNDGSIESRPSARYFGLPVVGFNASSFQNGSLPVGGTYVLANYTGTAPLRVERRIEY